MFEMLGNNFKLLMATPIESGGEVIQLEQLIVRAFEQSLVGGAFILLLWFVLNKQDKQLQAFATHLKETSEQLKESNVVLREVSQRLLNLERKDS